MITKPLFNRCLNSLKAFKNFDDKMYEAGIDLSDIDCVAELQMSLLELLSYCCVDNHEDKYRYDPNILEFFVFDLNYGELADNYPLIENSEKIILSTNDDVWKYLTKKHPEIADTEESEWSE